MKILVLDTETTGLSPEEHKLIEVAACIYDTATETILESYQSLIHSQDNACEDINNIKPEALQKMPESQLMFATDILVGMSSDCSFAVAHNAPFDKGFLEANGITLECPWVCSKSDIEYPGRHSSGRLGHLCYDFDIPVLNAHSALHDVHILVELLKKVPDLDSQLVSSSEPKELYEALVKYDQRDLAKKAGFKWNKEKRAWFKSMKPSKAAELTFRVKLVSEEK